MKNIIIVTGHGNYASGIQSMLEMVSGPKEDIYYVDFLKEDTDVTLLAKYNAIIKDNEAVLFVCDLLGGSPYKEAAKLAFANPNIKVVAGCNVGAIMDASFKMKSLSIGDLANNIIESSKKNLFLLNTDIQVQATTTDGI